MKVHILGISGSPRQGATQYCVRAALATAGEVAEVSTEFIDLRGAQIHYCIHCNRCIRERTDFCPAFSDDMTGLYARVLAADGLILGSPVYHMNTSSLMQLFLNRLRPLGRYITKGHWGTKVGGGIAVGGMRNGGQETTLAALNNFLFANGMVVVSGGIFAYNGGAVWSNDRMEEGARDDDTGMATVRVIGRRVAVTAKIIKTGLANMGTGIEPALIAGLSSQAELEERVARFRHR